MCIYIYRHCVDLVSTVHASSNALVYHHRNVTLALVSIVYNIHVCPWLSCVGELGCQDLLLENWVVRTSHWRTGLSEPPTGGLGCQNLPLEDWVVRTSHWRTGLSEPPTGELGCQNLPSLGMGRLIKIYATPFHEWIFCRFLPGHYSPFVLLTVDFYHTNF